MWMKFKLSDGSTAEVWCEKDGCKWIIEPELPAGERRRLEQELAGDEMDAADARRESWR